jgi:hypothetical protein
VDGQPRGRPDSGPRRGHTRADHSARGAPADRAPRVIPDRPDSRHRHWHRWRHRTKIHGLERRGSPQRPAARRPTRRRAGDRAARGCRRGHRHRRRRPAAHRGRRTTRPTAPTPAQPLAPTNPTAGPAPTLAPTATLPSAATVPPTLTPPPSVTPTPNPLASTRTVITTAPIAVGDETLAPGAALEIPVDTPLEDNAIPPGTPIRLPGGQVITLPAGTRIPAVENPTVVGAPLNAVLQRTSAVGDTTYAPGTAVVLPSGIRVLGSLEPGTTVLLPAGTTVQVAGRTQTIREPVAVTIGGAPASRPAALPATGDAAPIWWPAALGVLLALLGWRLRRAR